MVYRWGLVEGKDRAREFERPELETVPGTSIIALLWMMIKQLWRTGKAVIVYRGLYEIKALIGMY